MRKITILISLFIFLCSNVFSYELDDERFKRFNSISLGGGTSVGSSTYDGYIDFGFSWFKMKKNNFSIRNYIQIGGAGQEYGGGLYIRERLQFGNIIAVSDNLALRGYGIVDFSVTFFAAKNKEMFTSPYLLENRGLFGIEMLIGSRNAFFIEAGGGGRYFTEASAYDKYPDTKFGFGIVAVGGRFYF